MNRTSILAFIALLTGFGAGVYSTCAVITNDLTGPDSRMASLFERMLAAGRKSKANHPSDKTFSEQVDDLVEQWAQNLGVNDE